MVDIPLYQDTLTYTGHDMRYGNVLHVMSDGNALGVRSGIRPGDPGLTTTLAGSTISVSAGIAALRSYVAVLSSAWSGTLTAADATFTRIDLVYLRVWDNDFDGSGLRKTDVVYLAGTPSASPVAPTPAGTVFYIPLATITVPVSGGGAASVSTAVRPVSVAAGGILPTATAPTSPYTGQYYDDGTNLLRYNGSTWDTYQKVPGAWTTYTPTWTGLTTNPVLVNGTLIGKYSLTGKTCTAHINLLMGTLTGYGSGNWNFALPFTSANDGTTRIGKAHALSAGSLRFGGDFVISPNQSASGAYFPQSSSITALGSLDNNSPFTWASGDQLRITFQYEIA